MEFNYTIALRGKLIVVAINLSKSAQVFVDPPPPLYGVFSHYPIKSWGHASPIAAYWRVPTYKQPSMSIWSLKSKIRNQKMESVVTFVQLEQFKNH